MEQRKNILREAGLSYSIGEALPVLLSLLLSLIFGLLGVTEYAGADWYLYLSFLLPQLCFAATAAVFFVRSKQKVKTVVVGESRPKWRYFLIAVILQFGLLALNELNPFFLWLLGLMGYQQSAVTIPDTQGGMVVLVLFVVALLPALLEETLFRGIIVGSARRSGWGTATSVLLCGAMFALFHGRPEQTVYQFVCGACYALLAWRSGSALPTMLAHFLNNTLVVSLTAAGINDFPSHVKLPLYLCAGAVLIATLAFLVFLDKRNAQKGKAPQGRQFFLYALAGLAIGAISWISALVTGFVNG